MRLFPVPCPVFVGFHHRRVDVDSAEDIVQSDTMAHGQDELCDQVASMFADKRNAEDAILAPNGQNLDEAMRFPIGDARSRLSRP